jgi:hypothetical protein
MGFRFSSEFDCASRALETIAGLVLSPIVSLYRTVETGFGFISLFSFRTITGGTFPHASSHSQNLLTTPNPLKILITFDWKPRVNTYGLGA